MSLYQIPVTSAPDQSFAVTVEIDGKNKNFGCRLRYNTVGNYWFLTISDGKTDEILVDDIPILCGIYPYADLLKPYRYKGLGSMFIVPAKDRSPDRPDSTNLGTDYYLLWGDTIAD